MLREQREHLGDDAFFDIARGHVDEGSLRNLTAMLDRRPDSAFYQAVSLSVVLRDAGRGA